MNVFSAISTVADGSMKSSDPDQSVIHQNRATFLQKNDINPADTTVFTLTYDGDDYCRYLTLDTTAKGYGTTRDELIVADAVVVTEPYHGVMLPLADCVGAVIYDSVAEIMMVAHLGRHNLEQHGAIRCIRYLVETHGVNPSNLTAWLSPAAGRENYPLHAFDDRSLTEVATEQLMNGGIPPQNIHDSKVDTTLDPTYFSHSEFLQGRRDNDGRFAIVGIMTETSRPLRVESLDEGEA